MMNRFVSVIAVILVLVLFLPLPAEAHSQSHNHSYGSHGITNDGFGNGHSSSVQCSYYAPGLKIIEEVHHHYAQALGDRNWVYTHSYRRAWKIRTSCG